MRVALIGGAGFIGLAAARALSAAGGQVLVVDTPARLHRLAGDLAGLETAALDDADWKGLAANLHGCDAAVLLTWSSIPATPMVSIAHEASAILRSALKAIEAVQAAGVKRLVFVSSGGTVYGPIRYSPVDEDHPTDPISPYGIGKLAVEKHIPLFADAPGFSSVILRLSNPVGAYQLRGTPVGVVAGFVRALAEGRPVAIYGDGSVVRDFLDIEDAAAAVTLAVDAQRTPAGVFNVGSGEGRSLNEVLAEVAEVSGIDPVVVRHPSRPFDVPKIVLSHARFTTACGWRPRVAFRTAVQSIWDAALAGQGPVAETAAQRDRPHDAPRGATAKAAIQPPL